MIEAWDRVPGGTRIGDLVGRGIVVLISQPEHVVGLRVDEISDGVRVSGARIGALKDMHKRTVNADDAVEDVLKKLNLRGRIMAVPEVRLPHRPKGTPTVSRPWRFFSPMFAVGGLYSVFVQPAYWRLLSVLCLIAAVIIWWIPSRTATVGVSVPVAGGLHLGFRELRDSILSGKKPGGVLEAPPNEDPEIALAIAEEARAGVSAIKEEYGAVLADVAYRIENSALFDVSVPLTRQFTLAMAAWDDEEPRAEAPRLADLAREVELTFHTARRHAEAVGIGHLPQTAQDDALRASKAVRLAQSATTPGERTAALNQATRLLRGLALYYLPDNAETPALPGKPPSE